MTTIILDGNVIPPSPRGTGGPHPWWFNKLDGWRNLSDDKTPVDERTQGHGAFPVSHSWRASQAISFQVYVRGSSPAEMLRNQATLEAIGADGPVEMVVIEKDETTARTVTVETIDPDDPQERTVNRVMFDCLARDPRRYSVGDDWVTANPPSPGQGLKWPVVWPATWPNDGGSDGRITLTNRGTKASAPIYRMYGGFDSCVLTNVDTQQRVGFELPIPSGSYVEIDFAKRTATVNRQSDASRYLTYREWWDVPKQSSVVAQIDMAGRNLSPYFAGKVRSAW